MKSIPEVTERTRGSRCCDKTARPTLSAKRAEELSAAFDIFAHPVRLQLLEVLARNEGRVCVCDLEAAVPVKQPTVSHHLKLLRKAGLVERTRQGVWAYYSVNRDVLARLHGKVNAYIDAVV
jgi:ArsR family transcriptional regulator